MTFSYTAGGGTNLDRVRMLIGDTDSNAETQQRLEDEEITDLISISGGYRAAAAAAADALAAKYARLAVEKAVGKASFVWKRFEQLRQLAKDLRSSTAFTAVPFAGGLSESLRNTNSQDTDLVKPAFQRGMLDNPSTIESTST